MEIELLLQSLKPRGASRPTELEFQNLENLLSAKIPEPLRSILRELDACYFSGGTVPFISANSQTYCPQRFLGICDSEKSILNTIEQLSLEHEWVPFAEDLFGNLFFFASRSGEVVFVDYDEHFGAKGYELIAHDMDAFFSRLEIS